MPEIFDATSTTHQPSEPTSHSTHDHAHDRASAEAPSPSRTVYHRHVDEYSEVMRALQPSNNPLATFIPKPTSISFDSQLSGETVLLVLRRHLITQVPWVIITILLIFAPILFAATPFLSFLPARFETAAAIGWYLLVIGFALESFLTWFYNVYIITDERIIDVDFHSLLFKNISTAKLDNIEDVSSTASGALSSIFNYGTIKIQTAAATTEFEFDDVSRPAEVTAFIAELIQEEEREKLQGRVS